MRTRLKAIKACVFEHVMILMSLALFAIAFQ